MVRILILAVSIAFLGCNEPDCIQCNNVEGYPDALICRDTYETTMEEGTPTWKEYASDAIAAGCTEAE